MNRLQVQIPANSLPGNDSGQVVHAHVPLPPKSIIWQRCKNWERNGSARRRGRDVIYRSQYWRKLTASSRPKQWRRAPRATPVSHTAVRWQFHLRLTCLTSRCAAAAAASTKTCTTSCSCTERHESQRVIQRRCYMPTIGGDDELKTG